MAEPQGVASSFNPDDAGGSTLLDNARVKITKLVVDLFTAKNGNKFVNADVTFTGADGTDTTEHYMIGKAEEWAPNAAKNGVIALAKGPDGEPSRIWNKSDIFAFVKSLVDSGFPKASIKDDLSVFVGSDVHVTRVTQDGQTYVDKHGKERTRSRLLVTKVYELPKAGGGKATTAAKGSKAAPAAAAGDIDGTLTAMLVEIVKESGAAGVPKEKVGTPIFMKATRKKLSVAERTALQTRAQDDEFLVGLAEAGVISYDGTTLSAAA